MVGWPRLSSDNYSEMAARQLFAADAQHGSVEIDGVRWPAVTRDQALALVEYWRAAADDNGVEPPAFWYPIALAALGYEKPGDRFRSDRLFKRSYADAMLPQAQLKSLWDGVSAAAEDSAGGLAKPPLQFAMSTGQAARWKRVARLAWGRLKKERAAAGVIPPALPKLPPGLDKPPIQDPKKIFSGGFFWLALGAFLLFEHKRTK